MTCRSLTTILASLAFLFTSFSSMNAFEKPEYSLSLTVPFIKTATPLATINYFPKLDRFLYHTVDRFLSDTVVALEDGSQWKASMKDAYKLAKWRTHDWISISPKHWAINEYTFYLNNYTAGSSVEVNLVLGPYIGGAFTNTICGMDLTYGKVYLSNGTYWQVAGGDVSKIQNWDIGHTIIFGANDSWFTAFKAMLINVDLNIYIFAKEI